MPRSARTAAWVVYQHRANRSYHVTGRANWNLMERTSQGGERAFEFQSSHRNEYAAVEAAQKLAAALLEPEDV